MRQRGFTMIEVIFAMAVLLIAVSAMAMLAAVMLTRGRQSRYMNVAEALASEKLEDLSRWTIYSPTICMSGTDTSEGSLTTPTVTTVTCANGNSASVSYYDDVSIDFTSSNGSCGNATDGCFAETVTSTASGSTTYYTTYHSPSGVIPGNPDGTSNPTSSTTAPSNLVFHRSWLIENNVPVTGLRRVTVKVTLTGDNSVKPGVSVQMSMVRQ